MKLNWLHFFLIAVVVGLIGGWFLNYQYWEKQVLQQKDVALGVHEANMAQMDSAAALILSLEGKVDSIEIEVLNRALLALANRHVLITKAEKDSLDAVVPDSTVVDPPVVENIIDSVSVDFVRTDRIGILVYANQPVQSVVAFGTESENYTSYSVRENSFNYSTHRMAPGNKEGNPILPGTTYYLKAVVTDSLGVNYYSEELVATTPTN